MLSMQDFQGAAKQLEPGDIRVIAGYLGCEVAAVEALLSVEAAGRGFDSQGRPKMLFEPHIFYRELKAGTKRNQAMAQNLAYSKWRSGAYPSDSYPRLISAMRIDETAALRSASWGMGQVMGFNHALLGFDTPQAYVKAMTYSEGAHLYAMAKFIVGRNIQRHLRAKSWSSFAKVYNGKSYAKHGYQTKLAAAYDARPRSHKYVPPPASVTDLNMLLGLAVPPVPKPKPVEVPPRPTVPPPHYEAPRRNLWSIIAGLFKQIFGGK